MVAIRQIRELQDLDDVDPNALPDGGVPQYQTAVSSFVVGVPATVGAFSMGVTDSGNSLGDTGVTGPRVGLVGSGNLTLSQVTDVNGGTIIISGGTAGGGGFSAGVSGGNTAGDTGVTGSRIVLAGGNNITLSQATDANGASITVSGAAQTEQTQNRFDLTVSGNTAGAGALVSSGTLTLAGGSNITLSQAGNAITIVGASTAAESQTAISGIANSQTTYTSGTVRFSELGAVTIRSTTGNQFQISVNSQSVQPETQTFVGGVAGSNTTYTSGTVELTGSNIVTVRSSAGQRLVIDASQSVQTQNRFNLTLDGNTSGALAEVSSGTLTLAGGNNITLSQAGNAITISGPNAAGAQTGISGVIASDATYTSGTVEIVGSNQITVRSSAGQQVVIDMTQSVQSLGAYAVGNTTGQSSSTTLDARTVSLRGDGAVSVGYSNGSVRISAPTQSVQPETQTFIGGISASDTVYTSGTVRLTGVGGGVTVSTNTGQRIDISVAAQTGTQFSGGLSNIGNTSGGTGVVAGRLVLAGGNRITLSGSTNGASATVTVSAPNAQTGISSVVASDATYTSGSVQFTGSGIVTIRSSANQRVVVDASQSVQTQNLHNVTLSGNTAGALAAISSGTMTLAGGDNVTLSQNGNAVTISAASQTVQTQNRFNLTLSGNTAGVLAEVSSGTLTLAGGNNITVSQNGNAITISGPNVGGAQTGISGLANSETTYTSGSVTFSELGAITIRSTTGQQFQFSVDPQSVQTLGMYALGNTTAQSSSTTRDARSISFEGAGAVSVGFSQGSLRISAPTQSVQPETQTFIAGISASDTLYTSGNVRITGVGGGITVSSNTGQRVDLSVAAQTDQTIGLYAVQNTTGQSSSTTRDARSISVAGDGAVSVGYSAGSLRISAPTQTVQTQGILSAGVSNVGTTAGNTQVSTGSRLVLAGGGIVTASQATAAGASTITLSASQSVQSLGMYAVQNTTGQSSSTTMDARTISIAGDGIVSAGYSAGSLRISASQSVQTLGLYAVGNTTGQSSSTTRDARSVSVDGAGAVSVGYSAGTLRISAPTQTGTQFSAGLTNVGNTAGDTGTVAGRLVLVGSNNITLSASTNGVSQTISIIGGAGGAGGSFSAGVSTGGNTAGATGISGTQMVLVGSNAVTLSQTTGANGNTVSVVVPPTSVISGVAPISTSTNGSTISILGPASSSLVGASGVSLSTDGSTITIYGNPYSLSYFNPQDAYMQVAGVQGQGTLHMQPMQAPNVVFDRAVIPIIVSIPNNTSVGTHTISMWQGVYTRTGSTLSLSTSWSTSTGFTVGTSNSSLYGTLKLLTIPTTHTLTEGQYWMANIYRTTTAGQNNITFSQVLASQMNSNLSGHFGVANAASVQYTRGLGAYSVTTSGLPASIGFSQLTGTGSLVLRQPIFYLVSGTV